MLELASNRQDIAGRFDTHLEILVRLLLILLGHRTWISTGECVRECVDEEANADTDRTVEEDFSALAWRSLGSRTMRAKSNPVCCRMLLVKFHAFVDLSVPSMFN